MKILMLTLVSLIILTSCGQEETNNQFNKEKELELIMSDPEFLEYHNLIGSIAKLVAESETLNFEKYSEIMKTKSNGADHCDIDLSIFNGDSEMEFIARTTCEITIKGKAFDNKYPFFKTLPKQERLDFFADPRLKTNYDREAVKRKGEKLRQKKLKQKQKEKEN